MMLWSMLRCAAVSLVLVALEVVQASVGSSWVAIGTLSICLVGQAVLLGGALADLTRLRARASEAEASEHTTRVAAERALGNCCTVRPERTLTGDLVLHVVPAGTTVDLQPGVQLWHVYSGPDDITKVGRS